MKRKGTSCKFLKAPTNSLRTQTKLILLCSQSFHESICTWVSTSKIVQITTGSFPAKILQQLNKGELLSFLTGKTAITFSIFPKKLFKAVLM